MIRILLTVVVAATIGIALGRAHSWSLTSGLDEQFLGSRATQAEKSGEYKANESSGKPKVEVVGGQMDYEFGTMMHGETMSHEFYVLNAGDGPLVLEKAGSTCKCTVGEMEKSVLQPGEKTAIKLTWTAQAVLPVYGQSATFTTNDPTMTELKFHISGMIADSFVIEPSELALGDLPATKENEKTFYVFTYLKDSQEIKNLQWTDAGSREFIELESERVPVEETPYEQHSSAHVAHKVSLKLKPGLPLGPVAARIQFETDREDEIGTLELPVSGRVVSDISLIGGSSFDSQLNLLKLGKVKSAEGASVGFILAIQGEERDSIVPEIVSWEPADAMQVTLGEPRVTGKRKMYPIQVEVPKGAPEAYFPGPSRANYGRILIRTNHETIREIPIYVRLIVEN